MIKRWIEEAKQTVKSRRRRKPYIMAVVLMILLPLEIFYLSAIVAKPFGAIVGTEIHEILLALIGVAVLVVFRTKLHVVMPFHRPKILKMIGTALLWFGTYLLTIAITMCVTFFYPEEMTRASQSVNQLIRSLPILLAVFVVAVTPAICEEIAFRGAFLGCFREMKNKYIGLVIVSLIFGACHGSIWRMIPTSILGFVMGYILLETDNMFYNMLFHFLNNGLPVILLGISNIAQKANGLSDSTSVSLSSITLSTVGVYIAFASIGPLLIFFGNHLLHLRDPGYTKTIAPSKNGNGLIWALCIGAGLFFYGMVLGIIGIFITFGGLG